MISRQQHKDPPTRLPDEFLFEITDVLNTQYKNKLRGSEKEVFQANALIYQSEICLLVCLNKINSIRTLNIYSSIDYTSEETSINEAIYHLVDSIGYFLEEYFKSDRSIFLPEEWTPYEINNKKIYLKGDTRNLSLERIADNLIETSEMA